MAEDRGRSTPLPGRDIDHDWYLRATAHLDDMDRDAMAVTIRKYAMSWAQYVQRAETILRSTTRGVEDGLRAYRRATELLDVNAKTVRMDDLRIALAVCCQQCGGSPDGQMRMWRGSVVCDRCHDDGVQWESGKAADNA